MFGGDSRLSGCGSSAGFCCHFCWWGCCRRGGFGRGRRGAASQEIRQMWSGAFVAAAREAAFLLEGALGVADAVNEQFRGLAFWRVGTPAKDLEGRQTVEVVTRARALGGRGRCRGFRRCLRLRGGHG